MSLPHVGLAYPPASRPRLLPLNDTGWFADALGSVVAGSSLLLGGAPGSRKSGLATQIAVDLALAGTPVLYVPTEEPAERVWERAGRMTGDGELLKQVASRLTVERNPPAAMQLPTYVATQVLSPGGSYHGMGGGGSGRTGQCAGARADRGGNPHVRPRS